MSEERPAIEAFYLAADPGVRLCLLHQPPAGVQRRGCVIYVHPFAEEMNKSRRMAALQARQLASVGYAVLQIDLLGCGDSSGELRDCTISAWHRDLDAAAEWMRAKQPGALTVWGLRFGALLAVDWAAKTTAQVERLILWQPVASGETHLTQFLRIGLASQMLANGQSSAAGAQSRKRMVEEGMLEVGGYEISAQLAVGMDAMRLARAAPTVPVSWLEVAATAGPELSPASARIASQWRAQGARIQFESVAGAPFWTTAEITDCPALLEATTRIASGTWS